MDNSPPPDNIDDLLADSLFSDEHSVVRFYSDLLKITSEC